jgi:hypothetical protein
MCEADQSMGALGRGQALEVCGSELGDDIVRIIFSLVSISLWAACYASGSASLSRHRLPPGFSTDLDREPLSCPPHSPSAV